MLSLDTSIWGMRPPNCTSNLATISAVSYTHLIRKKTIFREGDAAQQVADLVAALKKDGHDFSVGIPMDTPIPQAARVVSAGKGLSLIPILASFAR